MDWHYLSENQVARVRLGAAILPYIEKAEEVVRRSLVHMYNGDEGRLRAEASVLGEPWEVLA